jgi:hypothetical protein
MDDPNMGNQPPAKTFWSLLARSLIMCVYYLAMGIGLLCVLYHLLALALSANFGGNMWPDPLGYGVLLAVGNLMYFVAIRALISTRGWRRYVHKPWIWLPVLFTIPMLLYLNYILVNRLGPYYTGF